MTAKRAAMIVPALVHDTNPFLAAALAYAAIGLYVLPCQPRSKIARIKGWPEAATTDPETIGRWWATWPDANVAIYCKKSGLIVIDVDLHKDKDTGEIIDGFKTFDSLVERLGPLPEAWKARTGGGGLHLIFRAPIGAKFVSELGPGVETRYNAYIVVAPSVHPSGGTYEWERSPCSP